MKDAPRQTLDGSFLARLLGDEADASGDQAQACGRVHGRLRRTSHGEGIPFGRKPIEVSGIDVAEVGKQKLIRRREGISARGIHVGRQGSAGLGGNFRIGGLLRETRPCRHPCQRRTHSQTEGAPACIHLSSPQFVPYRDHPAWILLPSHGAWGGVKQIHTVTDVGVRGDLGRLGGQGGREFMRL